MKDKIDRQQFSDEIQKLRNKADDYKKQMDDYNEKIREFQQRKRDLMSKQHEDIEGNLKSLTENYSFTKNIKEKLDSYRASYMNAKNMDKKLKDFIYKAFNNLTSKTIETSVTLPPSVLDAYSYGGNDECVITLYKRGFGFKQHDNSPSKLVSKLDAYRMIFDNLEIADFITKKAKREIFFAMSEILPEWMQLEEMKAINVTNETPAPRVKVDSYAYDEHIRIQEERVSNIMINVPNNTWQHFKIVFDHRDSVSIGDLSFGDFYCLTSFWNEIEETIEQKIDEYNLVADNNQLILQELKRKLSHHIVIEEL